MKHPHGDNRIIGSIYESCGGSRNPHNRFNPDGSFAGTKQSTTKPKGGDLEMPKANGTLEVHLTFKGLSKKALIELQGNIAKLGATTVELREAEPPNVKVDPEPIPF